LDNEKLTSGQKSSFTRLKNQIKSEAEELLTELRKQKQEISDLRVYLLDDDDEGICVKTQIDNAKNEVVENLEKIETLLGEIEATHSKVHSSSEGLFPEIRYTKEAIDEILEETSKSRDKFIESYDKLYGHGESEIGLEKKLSDLFEKYEGDLISHQDKSSELILQIEGALSGATNVELAKAFQDQKKSYSLPKNIWTLVFILSIFAMVYLANELNSVGVKDQKYLSEFLKRIPLFGPLIWLALFSSKQQGQNKRLEEEYAHKETITKTYVGHKRQIDKLKESDEKDALITKLASSTIDAIEFNPSSTLEKQSHKDDLPTSELLKIINTSIDKLGSK